MSNFIGTGTMFRYFRANHRYVIFFFVPLVQIVLFAAVAWFCARLLLGFLPLTGLGEIMVGLCVGVLVFIGLLQWPGRRWRVEQMLDDWIFAREYLYGWRSDMDKRLDCFTQAIAARARERGLDEIVLVGHSLGAMLALDVLDRALSQDGEFGRHGAAVCVLTVGATIPKFALHPAARRLREVSARIAAAPSIFWAEYQARDDIISFYKFDPVALLRVGERLTGNPVIRRVQVHQMLNSAVVVALSGQLPAPALSARHGERSARSLRLFPDGLWSGAVSSLDQITGRTLDFMAPDSGYREAVCEHVAIVEPAR